MHTEAQHYFVTFDTFGQKRPAPRTARRRGKRHLWRHVGGMPQVLDLRRISAPSMPFPG